MISRLSPLAIAGTLALAGQAHAADTLPANTYLAAPGLASDAQIHSFRADPGTGVVTALGTGASAVTYWVDEPEGFRVVTTIDTAHLGEAGGEDRHAVVRLSTILRPGQTQVISVPGPIGSPPSEMLIRRLGDRVEVRAAGPAVLTD
jgi:hypothetical protein